MQFRRYGIVIVETRWQRLGRLGLICLIVGTLCLDFIHGIALGQHQVASGPTYRVRQSLAVAISRLHDPAPGGYLAYKSVSNVLSEGGFAILPEDLGPHLGAPGWIELLNDGPRLDRLIQQARDVAIDSRLPPEIIVANELGYADYVYWSFRIFGAQISSLYYFFFLLVAISCFLYFIQFRQRPFFLFLLAVYLAELYFLQSYAFSKGVELNTIVNSRLFSALSLLPACHILFVLWQAKPLVLWQAGLQRIFAIAAVAFQSAFFGFILSCRTEVAWQVAMIMAAALITGIHLLRKHRLWKRAPLRTVMKRLSPLWPAGILLFFVAANIVAVSLAADTRYKLEPKGHLIWHEVLMGILSSNMQLRREHVGNDSDTYSDNEVYIAVVRDLNARNDTSSPISRIEDGHITFDLIRGAGEYDRLVRSLTVRIIRDHPFLVMAGLPQKMRDQIDWYTARRALAPENFTVPTIVAVLAFLACTAAGGFYTDFKTLRSGFFLLSLVLLFAAVTPAIEPSHLAVGTLFCYLATIVILLSYVLIFLARMFTKPFETKVFSPIASDV
jgi:hypothetical protein